MALYSLDTSAAFKLLAAEEHAQAFLAFYREHRGDNWISSDLLRIEVSRAVARNWPALIPASLIEQRVAGADGFRATVPLASPAVAGFEASIAVPAAAATATIPAGPIEKVPLGSVFGARSGDKGGNVNVGVWARSPEGYAWLAANLTEDRFKCLVPESADLPVERQEFPRLLALNFIVRGLLGQGAAASTRVDAQAKSMGEYLRAKRVFLPKALLAQDAVEPLC